MPAPAVGALVGVVGRALGGKVAQTAAKVGAKKLGQAAVKEVAEEGGKKLGQKALAQAPGMVMQTAQSAQQASNQRNQQQVDRTRQVMSTNTEQFQKEDVATLMTQPPIINEVYHHAGHNTYEGEECTIQDCGNSPTTFVNYWHPVIRESTHNYQHHMCPSCGVKYGALGSQYDVKLAGEFMLLGDVLVKDRKTPEAMRHKREYDTKYESSPERVKYREELNRERRRRGMYGSHDHKDISHTEGGGLTVESEHTNRGRHFKDKGTLRPIAKSLKDDLQLLRNLLGGPMDEQDEKIAAALSRTIDEQSEEEMPEEEKHHEYFGGSHRVESLQ